MPLSGPLTDHIGDLWSCASFTHRMRTLPPSTVSTKATHTMAFPRSILSSLAGGIALCYACAIWISFFSGPTSYFGERRIPEGDERIWRLPSASAHRPPHVVMDCSSPNFTYVEILSHDGGDTSEWKKGDSCEIRREWGWPMRCFEAIVRTEYETATNIQHVQSSGMHWIPNPFDRDSPRMLLLPLKPQPAAFTVNVLAFAISIWVLQLSLFSLRRTLRLRRGRCPTCGYDLKHSGSTCPECGGLAMPPPPTGSTPKRY